MTRRARTSRRSSRSLLGDGDVVVWLIVMAALFVMMVGAMYLGRYIL